MIPLHKASAQITGTVVNSVGGRPISGAEITLELNPDVRTADVARTPSESTAANATFTPPTTRVKTNENGVFSFVDVPELARYDIHIYEDGYSMTNFANVDVPAGAVIELANWAPDSSDTSLLAQGIGLNPNNKAALLALTEAPKQATRSTQTTGAETCWHDCLSSLDLDLTGLAPENALGFRVYANVHADTYVPVAACAIHQTHLSEPPSTAISIPLSTIKDRMQLCGTNLSKTTWADGLSLDVAVSVVNVDGRAGPLSSVLLAKEPVTPVTAADIAFIGDSITLGTFINYSGHSYTSYANRIKETYSAVENLAVDNTTTQYWTAYLPTLGIKPALVFIMLGVNDGQSISTDEYIANLKKIKNLFGTAEVIFITPTPFSPGFVAWNMVITDYSNAIKAEFPGAHIDLTTISFVDSDYIDGVHMWDSGQNKIYRKVTEFISLHYRIRP